MRPTNSIPLDHHRSPLTILGFKLSYQCQQSASADTPQCDSSFASWMSNRSPTYRTSFRTYYSYTSSSPYFEAAIWSQPHTSTEYIHDKVKEMTAAFIITRFQAFIGWMIQWSKCVCGLRVNLPVALWVQRMEENKRSVMHRRQGFTSNRTINFGSMLISSFAWYPHGNAADECRHLFLVATSLN